MSTQFKCEKCDKEYKSERFYLKHVNKCAGVEQENKPKKNKAKSKSDSDKVQIKIIKENSNTSKLTPQEKRVEELRNKKYKSFAKMTAAELNDYKQEQVELMELLRAGREKIRAERKKKAMEKKNNTEDIDDRDLSDYNEDSDDEEPKLQHKKKTKKTKSGESVKDRTCQKCGKIFKTSAALKGHLTKKVPCDQENLKKVHKNTTGKTMEPTTGTTKVTKNGNTTTTTTTINGSNMSNAAKFANNKNFEMLSKMANMGPNTHTRQTVNQLNANNIVVVPPSQEDLDMVVDYIYNKIMGEFEQFKQAKLARWKKEMEERQMEFLKNKKKSEDNN